MREGEGVREEDLLGATVPVCVEVAVSVVVVEGVWVLVLLAV